MTDAERIEDEAAAWVVRLHSDQRTQADRDGFNAWMEADGSHVEAFAANLAIWDSVGAWRQDPQAREMLQFAPLWSGFGRRLVQWGVGAAALAAAIVLAVLPSGWPQSSQRFSTVPGELRTISLSDGSTMLVNTDSKISTRFTGAERRVIIEHGQAYFRVAKDPTRPFRVFVGRDEVRAVGTAFEVRRLGDHAQIVLEEGRLAIFRGTDPSMGKGLLAAAGAAPEPRPSLYLSAGQSLELGGDGPPVVQAANVTQSSAWRYGRVVLDNERLDEAAADLNRYGGPQIVLADPRIGDIRISGVFHTGRPYDVVSEVVSAFPITVASDDGKQIVLAPLAKDGRPQSQGVAKSSR